MADQYESSLRTIHETSEIKVYLNPSGELFVKNKRSGIQMRISAVGDGLKFTNNGTLRPGQVDGMIGWYLRPQ